MRNSGLKLPVLGLLTPVPRSATHPLPSFLPGSPGASPVCSGMYRRGSGPQPREEKPIVCPNPGPSCSRSQHQPRRQHWPLRCEGKYVRVAKSQFAHQGGKGTRKRKPPFSACECCHEDMTPRNPVGGATGETHIVAEQKERWTSIRS